MKGKKGSSPGWKLMPSKRDGQFLLKYKAVSGSWQQHRVPKEIQTKTAALTYAATWYETYLADPTGIVAKLPKSEMPLSAPPPPPPKLDEFYDRWSELREGLFKGGQIEKATRDSDQSHWKVHIKPCLGHIPMNELSEKPAILREFIRSRIALGRADHTVRHIWSTLKQMLDDIDAEGWHAMPRNPARHPKVTEVLPPARTRAGKKLIIYVPIEHIDALLKNPLIEAEHKLWYLVGLTTGLRPGEMFGIRVANLTLDGANPMLAVRKAIALKGRNGPNTEQNVKTEDGVRDLPLHPLTAAALKWWLASRWEHRVGRRLTAADYVFCNTNGKGHRPRVAELLRDDLKRLGYPTQKEGHNITFQANRRSFSTFTDRHIEGPSVKYSLMGHSPPTVDAGSYKEPDQARLRRVVESICLTATLDEITGTAGSDQVESGRSSSEEEGRGVDP